MSGFMLYLGTWVRYNDVFLVHRVIQDITSTGGAPDLDWSETFSNFLEQVRPVFTHSHGQYLACGLVYLRHQIAHRACSLRRGFHVSGCDGRAQSVRRFPDAV